MHPRRRQLTPDPDTAWRFQTRVRRLLIVLPMLVGIVSLAPSGARAFHDGGVAHCNGCHTMHNSPDNPADRPAGDSFLLTESSSTDTCLRCHKTELGNTWGQHVLDPGDLYGGGQFVFLLEDNLNDGYDGTHFDPIVPGHQAGHSIISPDLGTTVDPVNSVAPGGSYPAASLHCTSCHDPHGRGGHFRLLYGSDYPESKAAGYRFEFSAPAPQAEGISLFGPPESNENHTAYQSGMSEWCASCHSDIHNENYPDVLKHPSGTTLGSTIAANYAAYDGSAHYTGDPGTAYLAIVPFEDPLMTTDSTSGPATSSTVMCLSCHRAHASSAPNSGRWDFDISTWVEEGHPSGSYAIPNPYELTAGTLQRSLCNKCHAKDPTLEGTTSICARCHDPHG